MNMQNLAFGFLAATAVGGIAWVFIYPMLSGERQAAARRDQVAKPEPAARRADNNFKEEREAGGGRAFESAKESRAHHTGTRQAQDFDSVTQTMAALNRACHAGR